MLACKLWCCQGYICNVYVMEKNRGEAKGDPGIAVKPSIGLGLWKETRYQALLVQQPVSQSK